jgi:hypothetical protein
MIEYNALNLTLQSKRSLEKWGGGWSVDGNVVLFLEVALPFLAKKESILRSNATVAWCVVLYFLRTHIVEVAEFRV